MDNNIFELRVFYEDTDVGGVVYHANYLKFFERARTKLLLDKGFTHTYLREKLNIITLVKSCNINFIKPARLDDELRIITNVEKKSKIQIFLNQHISCKNIILVEAKIRIAIVNLEGKISRMPNKLIDIF